MNNVTSKYFIAVAFLWICQTLDGYAQTPTISYTPPLNVYRVGTQINPLKPTINVGTVTNFVICPDLPDGLSFDVKTGIITGKPANESDGKYCVIAANATGAGKPFQLGITVKKADEKDKPENAKTDCCKVNVNPKPKPLEFGEWVLVFLPLLIFIIFLVPFLLYINSSSIEGRKFSLPEALSESQYPQIIEINKEYNSENIAKLFALQEINTLTTALPVTGVFPTTITKTDNKYRPSMSRLIAFLTTMLSLIIGLSLSCFFIYYYLKTGCVPDIGKLSAVLISMGIGVVPYAFNKVSSMAGNNPPKV